MVVESIAILAVQEIETTDVQEMTGDGHQAQGADMAAEMTDMMDGGDARHLLTTREIDTVHHRSETNLISRGANQDRFQTFRF